MLPEIKHVFINGMGVRDWSVDRTQNVEGKFSYQTYMYICENNFEWKKADIACWVEGLYIQEDIK